ncbi:MAG: hypothetical protein HWE27_13770 [Gammaproteobacteria bacterium]|nr:hypothetical protein [Gammaproteobacteria bacterium]
MDKFTRPILSGLLNKDSSNNSTSYQGWRRFFGYAITEIILVVLGILIAVALNNWNENRKRSNELNSILQLVKSDLNQDILETNKVENYYETHRAFLESVLASQYDRATFIDNKINAYVIMGFPELSLHRRGFQLLEQFNSEDVETHLNLSEELISFFYRSTQEVKADDEFRYTDQNQNFDYWKKTQDWWSEYLSNQGIDTFIEYALNDKDYRNRVASYYFFHYKVFLPEVLKYREKAQQQIDLIDQVLNVN